MAQVRLCSMVDAGGPHVPGEIGAVVKSRDWPGGGTTPVLILFVGLDTAEIWPADPGRIRQLADRLGAIAAELARGA